MVNIWVSFISCFDNTLLGWGQTHDTISKLTVNHLSFLRVAPDQKSKAICCVSITSKIDLIFDKITRERTLLPEENFVTTAWVVRVFNIDTRVTIELFAGAFQKRSSFRFSPVEMYIGMSPTISLIAILARQDQFSTSSIGNYNLSLLGVTQIQVGEVIPQVGIVSRQRNNFIFEVDIFDFIKGVAFCKDSSRILSRMINILIVLDSVLLRFTSLETENR
mmetsp:Transcript_35259/g.40029  ORF Transcript_35259/g.40029 Transcript_35259/m.40029 type:complete len:220 (-) Transcript_35259:214-873(-)